MSTRPRLSTVFALLACAGVLSGCGSSLPPRPLSAAQKAFVAQAPRLGVVAVDAAPHPGNAKILRGMLERTRLFERAVVADPAEPGPAFTATIDDRCSCRHGGWIPVFPILTLGVVPQFSRCSMGYAFTLREVATGREAKIGCDIKMTIGVGWLPAVMNVLPRWTWADPETGGRYESRLAYSIASRLAAPPSGPGGSPAGAAPAGER